MIDTIKGYILLNPNNDYNRLISNSKITISEYGYNASFNAKNIKITIRLDNDKRPFRLLFNGSLSKFHFGNNLNHLDKSELKKAITKLSDYLKIDMSNATLTRVDYGYSFTVDYPVHEYLKCLASFPRLESMRYKDSVTFFRKYAKKKLLFYDKRKEIKSLSKELLYSHSGLYLNQNILRYEIGLRLDFKRLFSVDKFTLDMLTKDFVQNKFLELWINNYSRINKLQLGLDPTELLFHHNGVYKYLSYHGIDKLGFDFTSETISNLDFDLKNPKSKRSKMKYRIKELFNSVNENTLDKNLIDELNKKIHNIKDFI
ncbi:phage/plasmid replication protein [Olleya sp. Hel_I_94]|uniref:phage/plasmid replication domain-containing protein n=1 Tax=Olleya sp. Hel_I_94 TaxID=1250001 RepID=UPI0011A184B8|nr:phage/plasmid replication protein [Olleya sp. Hel_I_94]TVZ48652.1 hypothetical protein JM82_3302 [Olleya sp. Hel_I_94]